MIHLKKLAFVGLSLICITSCQQTDTPISKNTSKHQGSFILSLGEVAEICPTLTRQQSLSLEFQSSDDTAFNLHFHRGKEVEYPIAAISSKNHSATIVAEFNQAYCLMWTGLKEKADISYSYSISN